jgi:hypothetical protein
MSAVSEAAFFTDAAKKRVTEAVVDVESRTSAEIVVRRDPFFQWQTFEARVALVFREFQKAWTQRDLLRAAARAASARTPSTGRSSGAPAARGPLAPHRSVRAAGRRWPSAWRGTAGTVAPP